MNVHWLSLRCSSRASASLEMKMNAIGSAPTVLQPVTLLDRDGVLNYDDGYIESSDRISRMRKAIRLNHAGSLVFLFTNPSGVARSFSPGMNCACMTGYAPDSPCKTRISTTLDRAT